MKQYVAIAALGGALVLGSGAAQAQAIIGSPGNHQTKLDVEIHGVFSNSWRYGRDYGLGWGLGLRVGIPLIPNGPIPSINNSLMLGIGADLLFTNYYGRGYFSDGIGLVVPLVLQWNFYLLPAVSLFLEGGVALGFDTCGGGCGFWLWPGLAIGLRIHFSGNAGYPALVIRGGFPTGLNIGIAF